jgi:hypothetical protein
VGVFPPTADTLASFAALSLSFLNSASLGMTGKSATLTPYRDSLPSPPRVYPRLSNALSTSQSSTLRSRPLSIPLSKSLMSLFIPVPAMLHGFWRTPVLTKTSVTPIPTSSANNKAIKTCSARPAEVSTPSDPGQAPVQSSGTYTLVASAASGARNAAPATTNWLTTTMGCRSLNALGNVLNVPRQP